LNDGSSFGAIKVIASGLDIPSLVSAGDFVLLKGISSLELDGSRKPLIRIRDSADIDKKN
jgi:hypothetical protein